MKLRYIILTILFLPILTITHSYGQGISDTVVALVDIQVQPDQQSRDVDTLVIVGPVEVDTTASLAGESATGSGDKLAEIGDLISFTVILLVLFILILTYAANRIIVGVLESLSEKFSKYRLEIKRLVPVVRILIWSFSIYIIIAAIIDPPYETTIAVLASVGIAVGFASQDILKNIFGGFLIILDRPFQVGDKIEVGEYYGEVIQIGLRSTRVVTQDDSMVTIPNSELMNKAVSNSNSSELNCQVVAEIYLPADVDIERVKRIAYNTAISSRYVYLKKPVAIRVVNEIQERNYVVKLRVKAYVLDVRYEFSFKSDMTELILEELNREGLIPKFNQPTLIKND